MTTSQRLVATAGNDAHSNVGLSLNDSSGNQLLGIKLDPYRTSFHLVRMHVLMPRDKSFEPTGLIQSIRDGHCFIGFDLFGDTSGFRFQATNGSSLGVQGDEITLQPETRLNVRLPVVARLVVLKNGERFLDEEGVTEKEIAISEPGVYRVEVYLSQLGERVGEQPWIISNPIYVR